MPVLCDFSVVRGADEAFDREFRIGYRDDGAESVEARSLRLSFNTGGRRANGGALLTFIVKGLTRAAANPEVRINGQQIGDIHRYNPASDPQFPDNSNQWFNQTIAFDASILDDGDGLDNTLEITSVPTRWQAEGTREDFRIRNIVCFFHQLV